MKVKFGEELELWSSSRRSSMIGMGNLSLIVNLLRALKSRHMHQAPYLFKTMTIRDEYGLFLA